MPSVGVEGWKSRVTKCSLAGGDGSRRRAEKSDAQTKGARGERVGRREKSDVYVVALGEYRAMSTTTHYAVLGVAEDAAYAQIRCRYLSCLLALHPDKQQQQEDSLSSSRFLRLQEAWDVLRDPQSRSSYDRHLASSRLLLAPSVAEDVLLEEMSIDCDDPETGASSYLYPCRCGDFFAVSLQELDELGFCGNTAKLGSCRSVASKDEQAFLQGSNRPNQGIPPHPRSMILPCGSCSLRIRLLF